MRRTPVFTVVRHPSARASKALLPASLLAALLCALPPSAGAWDPDDGDAGRTRLSAAQAPAPAREPEEKSTPQEPEERATSQEAQEAQEAETASETADRVWPLTGRPVVVRGWEPPAGPYAPGHRGVDVGAPPGTPVRAAARGRVAFAGRVAGRGVVSVDVTDSGGTPLRFSYEPVRARVAEGDEVAAGQVVGLVGPEPSHCASGCLHWGLRRGDVYLDPLTLLPPSSLRRGHSRLLPVSGVPLPDATPLPDPARGRGQPRASPG